MIFPFSHPVIALLLVIYPSRHRPSVAKLAAVLVTCFVCPRRNRRQMAGGWSNDAETSHKSIWVCCWNGKQTPMGWKSGFPFFWAIECGVTQFPKPYGSKKNIQIQTSNLWPADWTQNSCGAGWVGLDSSGAARNFRATHCPQWFRFGEKFLSKKKHGMLDDVGWPS